MGRASDSSGEEQLRSLLDASDHLDLPEQQRELLHNIFVLARRTAKQVLVPRADVVYLSTENSVEENIEQARKSPHTRFPLCENDLDHVIGLIHIKDLFRREAAPEDLRDLARPITFVPEGLTLDRLLKRMRAEHRHLVAVLDEYGGVRGIVTMEDIIEELVGEIQDEFDREGPELVKAGAGRYRVVGSMLIADLEDELDVALGEREEDTIGGMVLSRLGRRPRLGDRVTLGPLKVEVVEVQLNRIKTLRLTPSLGSPSAA